MHVEPVLGYINADEHRRSERTLHDPSLRMRARLAARATVRVRERTDGRGAELKCGLAHPSDCALPSATKLGSDAELGK